MEDIAGIECHKKSFLLDWFETEEEASDFMAEIIADIATAILTEKANS